MTEINGVFHQGALKLVENKDSQGHRFNKSGNE